MRVNGLYGHVHQNDARSLMLFGGFVIAFHLLALLGLLIPLAMFDPAHAPIYDWAGYFRRWVPIVTLAGALLFAVQMAWHVRTVRRRTDFRFVDNADEPRLCRIVEPLTIAAGLPTPYVAVIDSPALNAFACGIRRRDAVLVFTRGLIDGLDDDELAAVSAHEITHIVNGDIRLIAAANVCLDTLMLLHRRRRTNRIERISQALTLPMVAVLLPMFVVLILIVSFLGQLAVRGSHLTRLLIASSREFIADAEAIRLTHNPGALVSALRRIEGRSAIPGLVAGQDAMMIDGANEGAMATHPTIARRVEAIIAFTGSMALNAPARRDTRPTSREKADFGRRQVRATATAPERQSSAEDLNWLGLTREVTVGVFIAVGAFLWFHRADLDNPRALAATFDPRSLDALSGAANKGVSCEFRGLRALIGMGAMPADCEDIDVEFAMPRGEGGLMGLPANGFAHRSSRDYKWPDGSRRSYPPPEVAAAQVRAERCFQTDHYSVGDRGLHAVSEKPSEHETISLPRWLAITEWAAQAVMTASPERRDEALKAYVKDRKTKMEVIHRFFGEPGLAAASEAFAGPSHQDAIKVLSSRLTDRRFTSGLGAVDAAEMHLLAESPEDFISCVARRARRL